MSVAILTRQPDAAEGWALWHHPLKIIAARNAGEVVEALREAGNAGQQGHYALGFVTYEAGAAFDDHFCCHTPSSDLPLVWFAVFERWMPYSGGSTVPSPCEWATGLAREEYRSRIEQIKERIAAGETYQVNFTMPMSADRSPLMKSLFMRLYKEQPTPHAMYIETPEFRIASLSPELFFRLDGSDILCEPMKGTCPRAPHPELDAAAGNALHHSPKNRAENLMIVDMIRNDLGRIAEPGSVTVEALFKVTPWPTLWQMTSTVFAKTNASIAEVFGALFPSASITGAPKLQTAKIIAGLETGPRGLYTGAIGWIGPGHHARFAVAIRTVVQAGSPSCTTYHVGSGIVWDSVADEEYNECQLKSRILDEPVAANYQLLETLRWEASSGFFFLEPHLDRMMCSAEFLGFPLKLAMVRRALDEHVASIQHDAGRIRLLIDRKGDISVESSALVDAPFYGQPEGAPWLTAAIDTERQELDSPYWYHKTTQRTMYELARKRYPLADEVLLINTRDEVMEFMNGNIVVRRDGRWLTPPLASGLLPGVFRRELLALKQIEEAVIMASTISPDDDLYFINSVRGWRRVRLTA